MKKDHLIRAVSELSDVPACTVRKVLNATADIALESIACGEDVRLFGLGKLTISRRGEKRARNVRTGEIVVVPPRAVPVMKPSEALVRAANGEHQ
jgi:DNA-binding protein HU-beta